jgi:hypothetical protein
MLLPNRLTRGQDACRFDHLGPFLSVFDDKLCDPGERACKHRVAEFGEPHFKPGISEALVYFIMELVDNCN